MLNALLGLPAVAGESSRSRKLSEFGVWDVAMLYVL